MPTQRLWESAFPFLFGRAFIEAPLPSTEHPKSPKFPFLIGGAFIEALIRAFLRTTRQCISLLSVGTFIEASRRVHPGLRGKYLSFPYSL